MNRLLVLAVACSLLAACSTPAPEGPRSSTNAPSSSAPAPETGPVARAPSSPAPVSTSEAYRKQVAQRIVQASNDVFVDPLPKMLKSIVVVDVTLESDGNLKTVSIRRSNGYKALENTALNSVRKAGPFGTTPRSMRRSDGSVNFLETFLFRDDGRFQVRTLAEAQ